MKPINEYRRAKHFNLTGTDLERLVRLTEWLKGRGQSLIAVVPTEGAEEGFYTVRVTDNQTNGGIYDYEVESTWPTPVLRGVHTILEAK